VPAGIVVGSGLGSLVVESLIGVAVFEVRFAPVSSALWAVLQRTRMRRQELKSRARV
jgi:hypothetical protein